MVEGGARGGGARGAISVLVQAPQTWYCFSRHSSVLAQTHIAPSSGTRKQMKSGEKKSRDEYKYIQKVVRSHIRHTHHMSGFSSLPG